MARVAASPAPLWIGLFSDVHPREHWRIDAKRRRGPLIGRSPPWSTHAQRIASTSSFSTHRADPPPRCPCSLGTRPARAALAGPWGPSRLTTHGGSYSMQRTTSQQRVIMYVFTTAW